MKDKKASIETLEKMSKSMIGKNVGKKRSDETKRKISKQLSGKNNPQYGKPSPIKGKHRIYREDGSFYMSF